jgi:hypothetical protein
MNPNVPQEVRIINAISEQLFNSWPVSIIMIDLYLASESAGDE